MKKKSNYIKYGIIVIVSIFVACIFINNARKAEIYNTQKSVMTTVIPEILENEIDNVITERPNVVIYLSSGSNKEIKSFEKKMKAFVVNNNLRDDFIYINLDKNIDISKYYNGNYSDINLLVVNDGKVVSSKIMSINDAKIKDIYNYLVTADVIDTSE